MKLNINEQKKESIYEKNETEITQTVTKHKRMKKNSISDG